MFFYWLILFCQCKGSQTDLNCKDCAPGGIWNGSLILYVAVGGVIISLVHEQMCIGINYMLYGYIIFFYLASQLKQLSMISVFPIYLSDEKPQTVFVVLYYGSYVCFSHVCAYTVTLPVFGIHWYYIFELARVHKCVTGKKQNGVLRAKTTFRGFFP